MDVTIRGDVTGIKWIGVRDAAKYPTVFRTAANSNIYLG